MLAWPFLENTRRPAPFASPEFGSNTIPERAGTLAPSVVVTITGLEQGVAESEGVEPPQM
jgi:hypothetical protein